MKKKYYIGIVMLAILVSFQTTAQVDVTIRVDMSAETVSADGVHVAGSINGWNTSSTTLIEEGSTGIYAVTVQLNEGWHRYKFLNGNAWGTEEQAGYPCAPSNGDRFLYINNSGLDVILEPVPFNGCNAAGTGFEATFNVDMSSEGIITAGNVHMAGWLTDWNAEVLSLPNASGDIHSGTLRLPTPANYPITFEYKYLSASGWGNEEVPDAGCSTVVSANRIVTLNNSGDAVGDVFNGCNYTLSVENSLFEDMQVFYSREAIQLVFNQFKNVSQYKVFLYDITGKKVKSTIIGSASKTYLDVSDMQSGLYVVKIENNQKQGVKKMMIY